MALFTSDLEDGTIGVVATAGNVKVDIIDDSSENPSSLVGQVLQFQTSSNQRDVLFEPGVTFYTQGFKVKNTGDIPVNFRIYISNDENFDMAEFAEAFELWISTDPTDPSQAQKLISFDGRLEVGETSETYYLFVRMKETAENKFQGKEYTGIGVTVYAVQGNVSVEE